MSMRSLESALCREAREVLNNSFLRVKDMAEWRTGDWMDNKSLIPGETKVFLPKHKVTLWVKNEHDKRPKNDG
jgi:hypothetical protein